MIRPYLLSKRDLAYDDMGFAIYDSDVFAKLENIENDSDNVEDNDIIDSEEQDDKTDTEKENNKNDSTNNSQTVKPQNNYIGTIEIPKINLKKGFVSPNSKYNDINYNVTIIEGFDYPDVKNGNFILAAHSGTGPQSFFKNLYKLSNGDIVKITYKNKVYKYEIKKIYTQKKQGYLTIYRNINKTTLSLITCTKDSKTLQTVYIAELV